MLRTAGLALVRTAVTAKTPLDSRTSRDFLRKKAKGSQVFFMEIL